MRMYLKRGIAVLLASIRGQAFPVTVGLATAQVIVAVNYAFAARGSLPQAFGMGVALIAAASVAAGAADFGLANLLIRERASSRIQSIELAIRLVERLLLSAAIGAVVMMIVVVAGAALGYSMVPFAAAVLAVGLATVAMQSSQIPLRAAGRLREVAVATVVDRLIALACTLAFMGLGLTVTIALPAALAIGLIVDTAICAYLATGGRLRHHIVEVSRQVGPFKNWFGSWRGSSAYGVAAVVGSAQQLDVTVIGAMGGAVSAGEFGAVTRWTTPLLLPSTAMTQVGMAGAAGARDTKCALGVTFKDFWMLGFGVVAALAVAVFSGPVTMFVLGDAYKNSSTVLAVLAVAIVPTMFAQPVAMVLQNRGRDRLVAHALVGALVVRLGLAAALGKTFGAVGGAWAVLVQQALILIVLIVIIYRMLNAEKINKP